MHYLGEVFGHSEHHDIKGIIHGGVDHHERDEVERGPDDTDFFVDVAIALDGGGCGCQPLRAHRIVTIRLPDLGLLEATAVVDLSAGTELRDPPLPSRCGLAQSAPQG